MNGVVNAVVIIPPRVHCGFRGPAARCLDYNERTGKTFYTQNCMWLMI